MADGKMIGAWMSGNDLQRAEARAAKVARGNASAYVKALILADLEGAPPAYETGSQIIITLAKHYHPTLADSLAQQLAIGAKDKPVNQARAIARFLEGLNKALEGHFDPEQPYVLTGPAEALGMMNIDELSLERLAQSVADKIGDRGNESAFAESPLPSRKKAPHSRSSRPKYPAAAGEKPA